MITNFSTNNSAQSFQATKLQFKNIDATPEAIQFAKKYNIINYAKNDYNKIYATNTDIKNKRKPCESLKLAKLEFQEDFTYGKSFYAYFNKVDKNNYIKNTFVYIFDKQGQFKDSFKLKLD